jgi:TolA-binding protein
MLFRLRDRGEDAGELSLGIGVQNLLPGWRRRSQQARRRSRFWQGGALLALLAVPLAVFAQQQGNVLLESNEQIFCILAALNAGGYDTGLSAGAAEVPREEVRAFLAKKDAPIVHDLGKFYVGHRVESDPGADLGQYVSLALLLGPPPDFRFTIPQTDLPPDAKDVAGIVPLLKTFYNQGGLLDLWARVQPRYRAAVELYADAVRRSVVLTDAYFRFPAGAYLGRTYTIYLDLLGAPEQVQARIYGTNYYLVVTPSKQPKLNEIRHQYLHFLLDPLAAKYAPEIHQKVDLRAIVYQAPSLAADFKEDFPLLVTECLIRAAELRMDKRPKAEAERSLDEMTASGLILARYFYEALQKYEQQESSMARFYRQMISDINLRAEQKRLAPVKFTPLAAPTAQAAAPVVSEEERLLNQGDNFFYGGRYNDAKTAFQTVLEKFNPKSGRALFGMAVVASNMRKPDLAEEYFQKTLEMARDLRIVTWSHIYLGRLWDLKGDREKAVSQYRAASLTATAYPEAWRAVQAGLERPFGSKE